MRFPAVRFQNGLRLLHIGNAERNVIEYPHYPQIRMLWLVQHVFQPVRAVRDLQRHPVSLVGFHSSVPVGAKSKQVAVKVVFCIAVVNQKPSMDHVPRHCRIGQRRRFGFASLHKLDRMAFRVGDHKAQAVVGVSLDCRYLDPLSN